MTTDENLKEPDKKAALREARELCLMYGWEKGDEGSFAEKCHSYISDRDLAKIRDLLKTAGETVAALDPNGKCNERNAEKKLLKANQRWHLKNAERSYDDISRRPTDQRPFIKDELATVRNIGTKLTKPERRTYNKIKKTLYPAHRKAVEHRTKIQELREEAYRDLTSDDWQKRNEAYAIMVSSENDHLISSNRGDCTVFAPNSGLGSDEIRGHIKEAMAHIELELNDREALTDKFNIGGNPGRGESPQ